MATLSNSNNDTVINGTDDDDSIISEGNSVTIDGGNGKDIIYSDIGGSTESGTNIKISGGAGDDFIDADAPYSTLDGGAGNDNIVNYGWNVSINGGDGDDVIENYHLFHDEGSNVTVNGGAGDDTKQNVIEYSEGDGDDTIYYAKSNDTVQIATNSGYTSTTSGNDLIINVGDGFMTFKNAANLSLNIATVPYQGNSEELRAASLKALNDFIKIGEGTDHTALDIAIDEVNTIAKSDFNVIRLLGKMITLIKTYKHDSNGNLILDSNGNPVPAPKTQDEKSFSFAYSAILKLEGILESAQKIASGELSASALTTEVGKIASAIVGLSSDINTFKDNTTLSAQLLPGISSGIGLVTNIVNIFTDGLTIPRVGEIVTQSATISAEAIKILGTDGALAGTKLGIWLAGNAGFQKVSEFAKSKHVGTVTSIISGVFGGFDKFFKNRDAYKVNGLPTWKAVVNSCIDAVGSAFNTFANAFMLENVGVSADMIFQGVYSFAAMIKYNFQSGLARLTGGDVSQIKFQTESRSFTEIIGDALKNLITGTSSNSEDIIDKDRQNKSYLNEANHIKNFGSYCTITTGTGEDLVFNHEGTQSNYIDAGNDNDTVVAHGSNNTVKGGQGADKIALYSDGKSPAGGNVLDGGPGSDAILIDDSKYPTTTRKVTIQSLAARATATIISSATTATI